MEFSKIKIGHIEETHGGQYTLTDTANFGRMKEIVAKVQAGTSTLEEAMELMNLIQAQNADMSKTEYTVYLYPRMWQSSYGIGRAALMSWYIPSDQMGEWLTLTPTGCARLQSAISFANTGFTAYYNEKGEQVASTDRWFYKLHKPTYEFTSYSNYSDTNFGFHFDYTPGDPPSGRVKSAQEGYDTIKQSLATPLNISLETQMVDLTDNILDVVNEEIGSASEQIVANVSKQFIQR